MVHAPFSLLPMPYPKQTFLLAKQAATVFNQVIDRVAEDEEYLHRVLSPAAQFDSFTAKLLDVHKATSSERAARRKAQTDTCLAITRSDYMLHSPTNGLLQVELNTIASSFGCLSTLVGRMHRHILEFSDDDTITTNKALLLENLPDNNAMDEIADALGTAAKHHHNTPGGVMVMVVQPGERNAYDQRWLQLRIWQRHGVKTLRRSLAEISARGSLDSQQRLSIDGELVSVVYFRAGYTPDDYFTEAEWEARVLLEKSAATCCPTVGLQLAGAKKIQQDLAAPGVVEKYTLNIKEAELLRTFFAGLWSLDDVNDPTTADIISEAIKHPEGYVLKPQREGGGNNLYGDALKARLESKKDLGALILMQRILPPINKAIMVRNGESHEIETLSELGIYGTYLRQGQEVVMNRDAGHLVRTKAATSDEGGVAAGFAVLDSPIFY